MTITKKKVAIIQQKIFTWWREHKRDLPWRNTHDPYKILVSEIMLQQTQVARVIPKFTQFLEEFPTVLELSQSSLSKVIQVWQGMGYNSRAKNLHATSKIIVELYKGTFPSVEKDLLLLPGVGLYTARAIQVFAWRRDVAMVDTNIRQIISHYFFNGTTKPPKLVQEVADKLLPEGLSWEWHQALMDYGALALPKNTRAKRKKVTLPFKESNRFIRGRIIDVLCKSKALEEELIQDISVKTKKSHEAVLSQVNALVKDGLIERNPPGSIRLSEE